MDTLGHKMSYILFICLLSFSLIATSASIPQRIKSKSKQSPTPSYSLLEQAEQWEQQQAAYLQPFMQQELIPKPTFSSSKRLESTENFLMSQPTLSGFSPELLLSSALDASVPLATGQFDSYSNNAPLIPDNSRSPLGINLAPVTYYSAEWTFVNVFKTARTWLPQSNTAWDTGESSLLDLDEQGWVRSLPTVNDPEQYTFVGTLLLRDIGDHYPSGQYIVLYDGEGTLQYQFAATKNQALSVPGRDVLDVVASQAGIYVKITATDPNNTGNYIRNIRIITPGGSCQNDAAQYCETDADGPFCATGDSCMDSESHYSERPFHADFLKPLRPYSMFRYMDWLRTNVNDSVQWSERTEPEDASWATENGAPIEIGIDLANQLHAEPWFNIPHRANDDYIAQFAALVHSQISPGRRVYIEYANEIWNTAFSAGSWVEQQGVAAWPQSTESAYTKRINWHGMRSAQSCAIWKQQWGADADQVVCVLGAQAQNPWTSSQALDCPLWTAGAPCTDHGLNTVAIAPYFGDYLGHTNHASQVMSWTADADGGLDKLFTEILTGGVLDNGFSGGAIDLALSHVQQNATQAANRGYDLIAYEAGQHLAGIGDYQNEQTLTDLFIAANRDPRMYDAYLTYLQGWKAAGGKVLNQFLSTGVYSKYGSWGAVEYQGQTYSPKFNALMAFIEQTPRWWAAYVPNNKQSPLGMNLPPVKYSSAEWTFVDVFKTASQWIPQTNSTWDTGESTLLDVDAHGWVRTLPGAGDPEQYTHIGALLLRNNEDHYPSGQYVVLYDGEGTLEYQFAASKNVSLSVPGRDVLDVTPSSDGIYLKITATDPNNTGDYLRNIRIITPGGSCQSEPLHYCENDTDGPHCGSGDICLDAETHYAQRPFHTSFLHPLRPYALLRYTDWSRNGADISELWSERSQLDDASWSTDRGVPVEVAIQLSNQLQSAAWINIPYRANDDYITQLAGLVHNQLDPESKVYVEYASEVWTGSSAGNWIEQQALALWPTTSESAYTKRINWYGMRSAQNCDIWQQSWAEDADRVVCVLGGLYHNPGVAKQARDCPLWTNGAPCADHQLETVAITSYFGDYLGHPNHVNQVSAWTSEADGGLESLFAEIFEGGLLDNGFTGGALDLAQYYTQINADAAVNEDYQLLAYAGGQHLLGLWHLVYNQDLTNLFVAANRDSRMHDAYRQHMLNWQAAGGQYFNQALSTSLYNRFGSWGALEYQGQNSSPKFNALVDFIYQTPQWWVAQ